MSDDFDEWITTGIKAGWCGPPICETHDGCPLTEAEDEAFESGEDPCLHVVRLYADAEMKAAVEANHSPSVWRDTYTNAPDDELSKKLRQASDEGEGSYRRAIPNWVAEMELVRLIGTVVVICLVLSAVILALAKVLG